MSRDKIEKELAQSITNLTNKFEEVFKEFFGKKYHKMERDAHRKHFKFLKSLAKEVADKC